MRDLPSIGAWLPRDGDEIKTRRKDWSVVAAQSSEQSLQLAAAVDRLAAHEKALVDVGGAALLDLNEAGLAFAEDLAKLNAVLLAGGESLSDEQKSRIKRVCEAASKLYDALVRCAVPIAEWRAHTCDVFFSYSGEDRVDYALDTHAALQTALGTRVFLDKSLPPGEAFTRSALASLLTCKLVYAVVSRRFVTRNKWPLHELAIACARSRLHPKSAFVAVHDAFSAGEDGKWVAQLVKLPVRWLYAGGEVEQVSTYDERSMVEHRAATVKRAADSFSELK
jgi:hypothetical protein